MADETVKAVAANALSEVVPGEVGEVSAIASAHAPFVYFDGAPTYGFNDGVANITLESLRYTHIHGAVVMDKVLVAHLRTSLAGLLRLKTAVDGALLLAHPVEKPEGPAN